MPVSEKAAGCGGHGKCRPGFAPAVAPTPQVQPVPLPVSARGCKGRSPRRHLFALPRGRGPSQTPPSLATDSSISPGPPLSLAAGTARREPLSFGFAANHGFCPRGCKGRSPLHEITLILPLPAGKGVGGMGAERKGKAGLAGDKQGKPPAAPARPAPGERTISNAEVPLPRSPLSLAAGTAPHR